MTLEFAREVIFWIMLVSFLISLSSRGYWSRAAFSLLGVALFTTWWRLL